MAKTNSALLRSAIENPGFRAVFPSIPGASTRREIEALRRLATHPAFLDYLKREKQSSRRIGELETAIKKGGVAEKKMLEDQLNTTKEGLEGLKITFKKEIEKIETDPELKRAWDELKKSRE